MFFNRKIQAAIRSLPVLLLARQSMTAQGDVHSITSLLRGRQFNQALVEIGAQSERSPQNAQLWTLKGIAHIGLGNKNEALRDYRHALQIAPDYIPALKAEAQIEYQEGSKEGIATLHRVLRQEPNDPVSHAMLAALSFQQHDCQATVENYRASEELLANQPVGWTQYGQCLAEENQKSKAIKAFRQAAIIAPNAWQMRYNLSLEQFRNGQIDEARRDLKPMLTPDQHRPEVLNLSASLYEAAGDTPHAVEAVRRAIVDSPQDAELYVHLADLCFVHKSFQVALTC